MAKPEDDLPPFYIEAAQAVVLMHLFPNEAETGKAIEAVRRAILGAVEVERNACAAVIDEMMLCTASDGREVLLPRGSSGNKVGQAYASAIRNRKGA